MMAFLHIPKTAGTSARVTFGTLVAPEHLITLEREEDIFVHDTLSFDTESVVFGHLSWAFCDHIKASARATILRDPIERVVSQVRHWLDQPQDFVETRDDGGYEKPIHKDRSLGWNLAHLLDRRDLPQHRALSNAQTAQLAHHHEARPIELARYHLELAKLHLKQCDIVGRTNDIAQFLSDLASYFGKSGLSMPHVNQSSFAAQEVLKTLCPDTIKRICAANLLDLELFEFCEAERATWRLPPPLRARRQPPSHFDFSTQTKNARALDLAALDGHLRLQMIHLILDCIDLQMGFDILGFAGVSKGAQPREITALGSVFGAESLVRLEEASFHNGATDSNADTAGSRLMGGPDAGLFSIVLLDALCPIDMSLAALRATGHRLTAAGCLILQDGLAHHPADFRTTAFDGICREVGLQPAFAIDQSIFYVKEAFLNLYQSLFKLKMRDQGLRRFGSVGRDFLTAQSQY